MEEEADDEEDEDDDTDDEEDDDDDDASTIPLDPEVAVASMTPRQKGFRMPPPGLKLLLFPLGSDDATEKARVETTTMLNTDRIIIVIPQQRP